MGYSDSDDGRRWQADGSEGQAVWRDGDYQDAVDVVAEDGPSGWEGVGSGACGGGDEYAVPGCPGEEFIIDPDFEGDAFVAFSGDVDLVDADFDGLGLRLLSNVGFYYI